MDNIDSLTRRIDSMLGAERQRIEQFQRTQTMEYQLRQQRLERYEQVMRHLVTILTPRLRALGDRFNGVVSIKPARRGHTREMCFDFRSELAKIALRFSASPDCDVRQILFEYELSIVPALMKFEARRELRQSIDAVDVAAVVDWFDERMCDFVATYLSIFRNSYYLLGHQVQDPIAGISFPRAFAAATLQRRGQTYFFISPETRDEFVRRNPDPVLERNGHVPQDSARA
ncbi:MAG: hypothetical protein FJ271_33885 [Planctomycetes bacterium]|nr:hypothetical protein [Planctomycetota bacterium]